MFRMPLNLPAAPGRCHGRTALPRCRSRPACGRHGSPRGQRTGANRNCPDMEFKKGPPDPTDEPVSSLRDHVNESCASKPLDRRLLAVSSSAL